ncbi:MAG: glycosyltransferase family 2 protein [Planctomycetota bacterium]
MPKIRAMRVPRLVSVVIPNWNRKDLLQRCLRSVFTQAHRPLEVIVVDNASTDGSPELVRDEFPEVRLVRNTGNVGASRARNQALVLARGEYAWFLDNDSVCPDPDVLSRMLAVLDADPAIGCVGGELFPDPLRVRGYTVAPTGDADPVWANGTGTTCDSLDTLNLLARWECVERVGGFDPGYFYLAEDKDFCHRVRRAGWRIWMGVPTGVLHLRSSEQRPNELGYRTLLHRNRVRFVCLHARPRDLVTLAAKDLASTLAPRRVLVLGRDQVLFRLRVLARAYAWNFSHLFETLRQRRVDPDFLGIERGRTS